MSTLPRRTFTGELCIEAAPPEVKPQEGSPTPGRLPAQVEWQHRALATLRQKVRLMQEQTGSTDSRLAASDWAMVRSGALLARHRHASSARRGGSKDPQDTPPISPASEHTPTGDALFEQLWSANHVAFDEGDYETACDTLQATLTRARLLRDAARLMAVERKAVEQHRQLFEQAPGVSPALPPDLHPARWEAIRLVYTSLAQQASAFVTLLQRHA